MTPTQNDAKQERMLPAHVYDALAMSAAMYGGIGAGRKFVTQYDARNAEEAATLVPMCYIGHLAHLGIDEAFDATGTTWKAFGISGMADNDDAVIRIWQRKGSALEIRVTFAEWCAELNVVRGPEAPILQSAVDVPAEAVQ